MEIVRKKWMAVLLMFSMIATLCVPASGKAQDASLETVPEGYIGIYDIADLYGIRNDLTANYILMNDIDMSEDTAEGGDWNLTGHGWTPIDGFAGSFDGNGHRIIGMHIYGEVKQNVGLFGLLKSNNSESPVIRNLAMVDVDIDVKATSIMDGVGSIAGSGGANIEGCYATGDISVSISILDTVHIGGICGNSGGNYYNLYNACNIIGDNKLNDGTRCQIGGIVGRYGTVENGYNVGNLSQVNGETTYPIGGGTYRKNCYTLSGAASTEQSDVTVLFPTQLKDKRTLVGFDFDNVWEIDPYCDYPYPQLKSNRQIRIVSVDIVTEPTKTEYGQGDTLDLSGGTIKITYEDETTATIPITEDMVSGYDMDLNGEQDVIVSYCDVSTTYPITVKGVSLQGISLNQSKVSLERNKTLQLSVNYTPANASNKAIEWTSSDSTIAKVDENGLVTAKNKGIATISATSANGLVAQCEIEVLIPCVTITLDKTSADMGVGDTLKLTAQMLPLDTTDMLEWKTNNATVVNVSDGTVTAYSAGTATITAYVNGGVSAICSITVKSNNVGTNNTNGTAGSTNNTNGTGSTGSTNDTCVTDTTNTNTSKKSSFITNKKFKGTYGYKGKKGSYKKGWYTLTIKKITSAGKVRFQISRGGRYGSPIYETGILTAAIKGNKATFKYSEDGWGNKGKGTILFKKKGTIYLTVKQTYTASDNRSTLAIPKTVFKK